MACVFCCKTLLLSLSRLLSLRRVQGSISEIPCGTLETPATRSGCCGRTPGTWAGRTRCPTAGSCSTGPRWATSGRRMTHLPGAGLKAHAHSALWARVSELWGCGSQKEGGGRLRLTRTAESPSTPPVTPCTLCDRLLVNISHAESVFPPGHKLHEGCACVLLHLGLPAPGTVPGLFHMHLSSCKSM